MSLEARQRKDNEDFRRVMNTPEGVRLIAGLIDFCGVYSANPTGSLFGEGMRNVGLMLYKRAMDTQGGEERIIAARRERTELLTREEGEVRNG